MKHQRSNGTLGGEHGSTNHMVTQVDWVRVGLRVFGDDLKPEDVTGLLGCAPTAAYRKGDPVWDPTGTRAARTGCWLLQGRGQESASLEEQLRQLLHALPSNPDVWNQLSSRFQLDLYCSMFMDDWSRGCGLSPQLLSVLAVRHLALRFDIHAMPATWNEQDGDIAQVKEHAWRHAPTGGSATGIGPSHEPAQRDVRPVD